MQTLHEGQLGMRRASFSKQSNLPATSPSPKDMGAPPDPGADLTRMILALEQGRTARRAARRNPTPGVLEELRKARRQILDILGDITVDLAD